MNKVNTNHALQYFSAALAYDQERLYAQANIDNAALLEYKKTWGYRIFKMPYPNDYEYRTHFIRLNIRDYTNYINACLYHAKLDHLEIEWEFGASIDCFYKYCKDNSIPY